MDVFLLFLVLAVIGFALVVNTRLLLHYQAPEDSGFASSIGCKAIIVMSLTLAWLMNLLLPVDVRNSRPTPGFLDMQFLWSFAFATIAVFLVLIVPGAMFYHEVEGDDTVKRKRRHVIIYLFVTFFITVSTIAISFAFLSTASLPMEIYSCQEWQNADASRDDAKTCSSGKPGSVEVQVGFLTYIMAALCFVGWFFFSVFGGIGLTAAPLDMILAFIDRPRAIDEGTYRHRKKVVGEAAAILLSKAEDLQSRDSAANTGPKKRRLPSLQSWRDGRELREVKADYNRFKCDVMLLEEEFERLQISKFNKGESLVISFAKLMLGIFFAMLSFAWVLHIIIYVLIPQATGEVSTVFLNGLFEAFENSGFYPLGVAFYAIFNFYLLYCVVKGCMKFGMRIAFFSIHPMKEKNTPLSSILFNVEMVMISSAAVVQFSQTAFSDYSRLTDADILFSAQINHLTFFRFFFENQIFVIIILVLSILALVYFIFRPRDKGVVQFSRKTDTFLANLIGAVSPKTTSNAA